MQDRTSGNIMLFAKRASSILLLCVQYNDWLDKQCGTLAREEFRTRRDGTMRARRR